MQKKYKISLVICVIFLIAIVWTFLIFMQKEEFSKEAYMKSCDLKYENLLVDGVSMEPLIKNGSTLQYMRWYYNCWELPQKWDIVIYNLGMTKNELIKQIKVDSQDALEFKENSLFINGKIMKNSAWEKYVFNDAQVKVLQLYINQTGHIPLDSYLIFGDNVNNSIDSRLFWAVNKSDILAKVFINKE